MKSKFFSILGVVLTLIMLGAMFVPATPVAAQAYTPNRWNAMEIPAPAPVFKLLGGDVTAFAVGPDGHTIYATDTAGPTSLYKSPNGGTAWAPVTLPAGFTGLARLVAVAPDDPNVVAVVDTAAIGVVWFSRNGGATWASLGVPTGAAATEVVTDIAVSQSRADALLGRDIVACTQDTTGAFGDVYLIGDSGTWVNESNSVAIGATYDFYAVKFEPNWLGGRSVVAVGFNATQTHFVVIRTAPLALALVVDATMAATGAVMPTSANIASASLALPSDFDSTNPPAIEGYVGLNGAAGPNYDVYRQDFLNTRKLEIATIQPITSISFLGTLSGGTLAAGGITPPGPQVWTSANPNTALPTWAPCNKPPTGAAATGAKVQLAPDFDTSKVIFASTTGLEAAFSRSTNGGVSFNQIGLINTNVNTLDDVMPAPDNATLFLSTSNFGPGNASLWRSTTPPTPDSWERVQLRPNTIYIIRLSPDYLTDATLYWCKLLGNDIQLSNTKGELFANRTAAVAPLQDLTVESKDIVYMASGNNVYKSTNGSWFYNLPVPAPMAATRTLAMAPTYPEKPKAGNVIAGGFAGEVGLSTDGGASFFPLAAGVGGGFTQVCADKGYASNNMIYAGSTNGAIFRFEVGVSTAWEAIDITAFGAGNPVTGLATESGTLYGAYWWGAFNSAVDRTLAPFVPDITQLTFVQMDVGAVGYRFNRVPSSLRAAGTATETWLWAIDTSGWNLISYNDTMAKTVVKVNVAANIPNDPTTGRNIDFIISWAKPSNATAYDVGIYTDADCSQLWLAAPYAPALYFGYIPSDVLNPSWRVPNGQLAGGQKYYVRVFCTDQAPADAIDSPRAPPAIKVVSFTVAAGAPIEMPAAGPTLLSPQPGDMNVPLRPGFSWATMPGATGATGALSYEFVLATDSALTQTLAGTPATVNAPSFSLSADLTYDTTYYYAVRVTAPTSSAQSIASFHTMAKPVEPLPPVTIPAQPAPITPAWIWAIVIIGAILVIAVVVLIVTTRRTP